MNKQNKNVLKTVGAVVGAVAIAGLGVAAGFALDNPETITKVVTVEVPTVVTETVTETVEVEVPYNVTVVETEYVDNGDMDFALNRLEDKGVIADADEIVEELKAEDAAIELAVDEIRSGDLFEMMEDNGLIVDDDDAILKTVHSDYEDIVINTSDFDDEEYSFDFEIKVYDEEAEDYVYATVSVEVNNGEAELVNVI